MPTKRIDAEDISTALLHRANDVFMLPRYTPAHWWECDVIEITASAYFREYEIKVSRQDFFDDAKKRMRIPFWERKGTTDHYRYKHDLLARGHPRGPCQFWFVTPVDLVTLADIPSWAGWQVWETGWWMPKEVKPAPRLHNNKVDVKFIEAAKGVCYGRYHHLRRFL